MKLALVVPSFPQLSETFIVSKALGLVDRGWDVRVVTNSTSEDQWRAFGHNHPVHRLRPRVMVLPSSDGTLRSRAQAALAASRQGVSHPLATWRLLRRAGTGTRPGPLARAARESTLAAWGPDAVHIEFGALAPELLHLKTGLGCPLTMSLRGYDIAYAGLDRPGYYDTVWETVDAVHVLSHGLWQRALERGAPADLAHHFITPAVDCTRFTPTVAGRPTTAIGTATRPARLVSVGRLHWKKGYDYALDAVAMLRSRGISVDYRIVGDGDLFEAVCFWRHQLGLDDCVTLLGGLTPDRVADELARADVFLHPSISEGFGNAPLEAQASGVPVVSTDAEGLTENVAHEETGLVVPRRNASALADALERLIRDDRLRATLGRAGPRRVQEHFDLPQHLQAWDRFYRDVLGAGP